MKIKILYSITAILFLTLSFVVYASINTASANNDTCCAMADCCKDGKCSMNNGGKCNCKSHSEHKCSADCCKDGKCTMSADGKCACEGCKDGMCKMHKKDGAGHTCSADCCKDGKCSMSADGKCKCNGDHVCSTDCCKDGKCKMSADGKCACENCKDGMCKMHKKDGDHQAMKGDCCKGKDSCPMKKGENKDKPKDN